MPQPKKQAETEPELRFKLFGHEYKMASLDTLTYDEIELIEDAMGASLGNIDITRAKFQRWMIYVSLQRAGRTDVSFEDLGRVKWQAAEMVGDDADEGGVGPTSPSENDEQ